MALTPKQTQQLTGILKDGLKLQEKSAGLDAQIEGLRREAASIMDDTSFIVERVGRITRSPNSRTQVDRKKLLARLAEGALKFFMRPVFTKETLDEAVSQGIIDADLYGKVVELKMDEKRPWKVSFVPDQG
jgi:hypothetical protein